jgi:predicted Zn-dependent protease
MTTPQGRPTTERIKNLLWFAVIAILVGGAVALWIHKRSGPARTIFRGTDVAAEQQRIARLQAELREIAVLAQQPDQESQDEMFTRLENLCRRAPDFYLARQVLVRLAVSKGRLALAEKTARGLMSENPDEPGAHALLGTVLVAANKPDEAIAEVKKAFGLADEVGAAPDWTWHGVLAEAYLKKGDLAKVDAHLRKIIEIDLAHGAMGIAQSSVDLSERLGRLLFEDRKPEHAQLALRLLGGVARYRAADPELQFIAAVAAVRAGKRQEAQEFYDRLAALAPDDPNLDELREHIAALPETQPASQPASAPGTQPVTAPGTQPATAPALGGTSGQVIGDDNE